MIPKSLLYTHEEGVKPLVKSFQNAGIDLAINDFICVEPHSSTELISTGIKVQLPPNTVGLIWTRSSLAMKGIEIGGGVIDEGYRGEIKLILQNHSEDELCFQPGDRVAQLIIQSVVNVIPIPVQELSCTTRGGLGFGSTDIS